ncbi:MAG: hypothetical protein AAF918_19340 [Pseudomonadota bacterium]
MSTPSLVMIILAGACITVMDVWNWLAKPPDERTLAGLSSVAVWLVASIFLAFSQTS